VKDTVENRQETFRFLSRTGSFKNYIELKPYDKAKFEPKEELFKFGKVDPSGRFLKSISLDNISLYKIETNVLGRKFIIKQEGEKPQLTFKNF